MASSAPRRPASACPRDVSDPSRCESPVLPAALAIFASRSIMCERVVCHVLWSWSEVVAWRTDIVAWSFTHRQPLVMSLS